MTTTRNPISSTSSTTQARMSDILSGPGFYRSLDGQWIAYCDGAANSSICRYADAFVAEADRPADFDETTGWVFGDNGFDWVEATMVNEYTGYYPDASRDAYEAAVAAGAIDFGTFAATIDAA